MGTYCYWDMTITSNRKRFCCKRIMKVSHSTSVERCWSTSNVCIMVIDISTILTLQFMWCQITQSSNLLHWAAAWEHTHTQNEDIIKLREVGTSDKTLQLILGVASHEKSPPPSIVSTQLLGFLPLRRSRQFYCPPPHAANLSPLTRDFTLFKLLVVSVSPSLIRRSRNLLLSALAGERPASWTLPCQDSSSALWQQSKWHGDHFNAIVPQGSPPVSLSPASCGWILEGRRFFLPWTWHLHPCRAVFVLGLMMEVV